MQTFISETLLQILKTTQSFDNVCFVLPSQRAGVFVKQELKNHISAGFLPEILNIEQFVSEVSEIKKIDSVQLLFHLYGIYKQEEQEPVTFDVFSSWAFTIIQDFNEIDQHLVAAKEIFVYLRDIHRLKKWSVKGEFKETELIKDHLSFMEKLSKYYDKFYQFLLEKGIGYQGILYREATNKIDGFIERNAHKKFFFIGFNALNKAEELLFQKMLMSGNTQVFWDIDTVFLKGNHQAGRFIRKYKKNWKYYEKNALNTVGNTFSEEKNIQIIGASKNITQVKYAGEILQKMPNHNKTALVLADESLLPITLNSLPKNTQAINITMGYPLKDIPTTSLIFAVFQLFLTQEKLQKTVVNQFYYKDVIGFFKQAAIYKLLPEIAEEIATKIASQNSTFIDENFIDAQLTSTSEEINKTIASIFKPFVIITDFLDRILQLIELLKEDTTVLEKEYLFRFYTAFTQLQNLHLEYNYIQDLKTLYQFFKQLIDSETLSFQGEPLQGLQLMGMLETRVLDFENVILTSVNEGVLPASATQNTFIPFDVKVAFDLPTYREKDAIFSYHFFRLIQRAKNVYILYNTEHDSFGSGEKSRFITQLEMLKKDFSEKIISPKVVTSPTELKEISKSPQTEVRLKVIAESGLSPSALTNYLYNPIAFYKQKILRIREFDDVEETVAANTMGTVVHEVLDELYKPFVGKFITADNVTKMQQKVEELTQKHFKIQFKDGDISTGKNRLIFEVAKRFTQNFLSQEKTLLKDKNNQLKIIDTEKKYAFEIEVEGIDFPIKIHGEVDRVDELNGVTRIIDYKTGMVKASDLKIVDFDVLNDFKYAKAIQVLLYSYLYTKTQNYSFNKPIEGGIYSFKNLNNGFLKLNFSEKRGGQDNEITEEILADFISQLKGLIKEIYNKEITFKEPADLPF
ncbi:MULTISPECIES: PD-(D/E)XK nuclease family protein [Tenacibaculum]|uniref:PD-(D/E)XK nuclease family protein n=1 Tax=Tenacibaculum TaxID=104267 RepID=UPI001F0B44B1|nr:MULTISPECIES: PD-(D/E)XK nuclease family protein [Tenacibaculum]MCH3881189.1 PD-(D/E)XK nuclease family protein [Tenacibaculum aquimarinum]MDO6599217.1 PD-(D/E)XK nuclease family protein [Tenacibaculum sp. 1_MG-2023]